MSRLLLYTLVVISCSASAMAAIPNLGPKTLSSQRKDAEDSDFTISFNLSEARVAPNYWKQSATVDTHPTLGAADVQTSLQRVALRSQKSFAVHSHPRAAETMYLQKGKLDTFFRMEGDDEPRVVRNRLLAGQAVVFPQGLAHGVKCVSTKDCVYVVYYTSADAGFVAAPRE